MAEPVASLRALLSLDSAAFERGSKRAQASMSKLQARMHRIGRDMQSVGKKMALGITTPLAAGTAAMVATTMAAAVEIDRLAKVSNSGRTEFQRFSSAAKTVGIEQEKLSDILKDVNDRVGDFIATGGGPMVDFFENIAPKVGVTAAQFEKLSGPDALQLYVSSLEEAGVSQQEMTFYLEAMASDLTLLQPLLANGGKGLKELGDQAERTGAVIDEKTIAALLRAKASMRELGNSVAGIKNQIVSALAPTLESIAEAAKKLANWFATLSPEMKKFAAIAAVVAAALGPVLIAVGFMASGLTALIAPIGAVSAALATLALNPIAATITAITLGVAYLGKRFYDLVKSTGGVRAAFDHLSASVKASFYGLGASILETMGSATGETTRLFIATGAAMSAAISTAISEVVAVISRLPDAAMEVMVDFKNSIVNGISDTIADAVAAATKLKNAIKNALKGSNPGESGGMRGQVKSGTSGGASGGWSDGLGLPEIDGGAYGDTLGASIGAGIASGMRDALDINSPSGEGKKIGGHLKDGVEIGADGDTMGARIAGAASAAFAAEATREFSNSALDISKDWNARSNAYSEAASMLKRKAIAASDETTEAAEKVIIPIAEMSEATARAAESFTSAGSAGTSAFAGVAEQAKAATAQVGKLDGTLSTIFDAIGSGDLSSIGSNLLSSAGSAFSNLLKSSFTAAKDGTIGGFASVLSGLKASFTGIGSAFSSAMTAAGGGLSGLLSGVGGAISAAMPLIGAASFLISGLKKQVTQLDGGLLVDIDGTNATAKAFSKVEETRLWGLLKKTKETISEVSSEVSDALNDQVELMQESVLANIEALGGNANALDGFTASLEISTKNMDADQAAQALSSALEGLADQMAETAMGTVDYIQTGETASDALTRLASSLTTANASLDVLGLSLFDISLAGGAAASAFADLFGGVDAMASAASFYFENFYSDAEKLELATSQISELMSSLGVSGVPKTIAEFRAAVKAFDDAGNRSAVAQLIELAPTFQTIAESAQETADSLLGALDPNNFSKGIDYDFALAMAAAQSSDTVSDAFADALSGADLASTETTAAEVSTVAASSASEANSNAAKIAELNAEGARILSIAGGGYYDSTRVNSLRDQVRDLGGLPSFMGGGFTGAGSRSGGVDGKGGFNAILHRNESVIDHTKERGLSSEIRALRREVAGMRQDNNRGNEYMASEAQRQRRIVESWDVVGLPVERA